MLLAKQRAPGMAGTGFRRSSTSTARRACRRCGSDSNPRLYRLLKEFDALTGVPVLLNTSFNVKGEPIVETPHDALDCFLTTGIDYLALHDTLISKSVVHRVLAPFMRASSEVASIVRTGINAD